MKLTVYHENGADGKVVRYVRPYLGTDSKGRRIRPRKSFPEARSDEEALALAREWLPSQFPTAHLGIQNTLEAVLATYVALKPREGASDNTIKKYESYLKYVTGSVARKAPSEVTSKDVLEMQDAMLAPKREGGRGLSRDTVIGFHWFLSGAWRWMIQHGIADTNPVDGAGKPEPSNKEANVFDAKELADLEVALREECMAKNPVTMAERVRLETARAATIALHTGMRVGEVCAIRRRDVNHALGCIYVSGTIVERRGAKVYRQNRTKTRRRRSVAVSHELMRFIDSIIAEHKGQETVLHGPDAPVIACRRGWTRPSEISKAFKVILLDHGISVEHTFHSLRHTHATTLLMTGADLKTVSERLGHANPATTLNKYSHVLPGRDALVAEAFSNQHALYTD